MKNNNVFLSKIMKEINLLPQSRQEELYYENILQSAVLALWVSLASFVLIFGVQQGMKFYLESKAKNIAAQIQQLRGQVNKDQNAKIKSQIDVYNGQIADYQNLASANPKWSQVLKAFAPLPPAGINIISLSINSQDKSVAINGYSPTRDLVLTLYNNILQDKQDFYNIDYPLENLIKVTDVSFHFTFFIQDSLLK